MSVLQKDDAAAREGDVPDGKGFEEFRPRKLHLPSYLLISLVVPIGISVLWRVDVGAVLFIAQLLLVVTLELRVYSEFSKWRIFVGPSGIRPEFDGEGSLTTWDEIVDATRVVNERLLVLHLREGGRIEFTPGGYENSEQLEAYIRTFLPEHVAIRETRSNAGQPLGALLIGVITVVALYVIFVVYWWRLSTFWVVLAGLLSGAALGLFVLVRFGASSATCRGVCMAMVVGLCALMGLLVLAWAFGLVDWLSKRSVWHTATCVVCCFLGCLVPLLSARIVALQRRAFRPIGQE